MRILKEIKRKHIVFLLVIVLSLITVYIVQAVGSEPGTDADPIVTQSYVDSKVNELNTQISNISTVIDSLTVQINDLKTRSAEITNELNGLSAQNGDFSNRINDLVIQNNNISSNIDSLTASVTDLSAKLKTLTEKQNKLSSASDQLTKKVDELTKSLSAAKTDVKATPKPGSSSVQTQVTDKNQGKFVRLNIKAGKRVIFSAGTEFVLRLGTAKVIAGKGGGLVDLTEGSELTADKTIIRNHLYIIPLDDGRGIRTVSEVWLLISGTYTIK